MPVPPCMQVESSSTGAASTSTAAPSSFGAAVASKPLPTVNQVRSKASVNYEQMNELGVPIGPFPYENKNHVVQELNKWTNDEATGGGAWSCHICRFDKEKPRRFDVGCEKRKKGRACDGGCSWEAGFSLTDEGWLLTRWTNGHSHPLKQSVAEVRTRASGLQIPSSLAEHAQFMANGGATAGQIKHALDKFG